MNKLSPLVCFEEQEEGATSLEQLVGLYGHIRCLILMLNDLRRTSHSLHKGGSSVSLLFQFLDLLQFPAFASLKY